ncbi:hypothetical protein [Sphingomonas profundi]|uniref:hypothetical protein n=1 Tax=Alterirhizorhabdus profundi TaxID=2681549 RepID=UPI0012E94C60|nr:hypothetical protein [Sphingomonas profundi]
MRVRHDRSLGAAAREVAAPATASSGRWWIGLIALWLVACLWLLAGHAAEIAALRLPDSDDDLRLLQVRDWLDGQGWFDLRQHRLDPPAGADIHWSRLVDLPLAAIVLVARPLLGGGVAEAVAAAVVPLLTLFGAMALLALIARRAIAPAAWWWAPLLLLMASPALGMMAPLRIDHHGWQIVGVLALAYGLVMPARARGGATAGVAVAASLAIGVEMLPFLGAGMALAAIGFAIDGEERVRLRALCASAGGATVVALLAFVAPARRLGSACDALSATWALPLLAGCAVLVVGSVRAGGVRARWLWLGAGGLAAIGTLLVAGGGACLIDPYRAVDPVARALWLDRVSEALPLWRQTAEVAWASLALPLIGLAGGMLMLRRAPPEGRRMWAVILVFSALSILLALAATRGAVVAQALALPGAAALGHLGRERIVASGRMIVRVFGQVLLFLLVSAILPRLAIAALLAPPAGKAETMAEAGAAACMRPRALAALDALPPATLFGFLDATPALLLHSHHSGIAGPYHRNGRAIADVMRAWAGDPAIAEAIVRRHRAAYVILCGDPAEAQLYDRRGPDGLHARLIRGETSAWLTPVKMNNTPWRVWRVRPPLRAGPPAA